jgi:aflatoxin B1 aldehyde reductase
VPLIVNAAPASHLLWHPLLPRLAATGSEELKAEFGSLSEQLDYSNGSLRQDCADLWYLHMPDAASPLEDILGEADALHKAGKFKEFGISNFNAWQVVEICTYCAENGYVQPTVYQGM